MSIYARRNWVISQFGPNIVLTQPLVGGQVLLYDALKGSFINAPAQDVPGSSAVITVDNITQRNALSGLSDGTLVFVKDTGNGSNEYAMYMWSTTTLTWLTIATQDSANTDANTFTFTLNYNSPTTIDLGKISAGHRAVTVSISVLVPFNGATPTVTIGDDTNGSSDLMSTSENDLEATGEYQSSGNFVYPPGDETVVKAYYNSGGSTIGQAVIIVSYV